MRGRASVASPVSDERLIFSMSVESLFKRGVGDRMSSALKKELTELGFNPDKLMPAYPSDNYQRMLSFLCRRLYSGQDEDAAQYDLGYRMIGAMMETFFGKAFSTVVRMVGTKRALLRLPSTSKSSTNFVNLITRDVGPNEIELEYQSYVGRTGLVRGAMVAAVEFAGGKRPKCEIRSWNETAEILILRLSWS
jgi:uncharacterized protein (TIGR02265 family)